MTLPRKFMTTKMLSFFRPLLEQNGLTEKADP